MRLFPNSAQIAEATANIIARIDTSCANWNSLSEAEQQAQIKDVEEIMGIHDSSEFDELFHAIVSELLVGFDIDGDNAAIISNATTIVEDSHIGAFEEAAHLLEDPVSESPTQAID